MFPILFSLSLFNRAYATIKIIQENIQNTNRVVAIGKENGEIFSTQESNNEIILGMLLVDFSDKGEFEVFSAYTQNEKSSSQATKLELCLFVVKFIILKINKEHTQQFWLSLTEETLLTSFLVDGTKVEVIHETSEDFIHKVVAEKDELMPESLIFTTTFRFNNKAGVSFTDENDWFIFNAIIIDTINYELFRDNFSGYFYNKNNKGDYMVLADTRSEKNSNPNITELIDKYCYSK